MLVDDVTDAFVGENTSDTTDASGLPPHSFEVVANGGIDTDIAQSIWDSKPAGIRPFGTTSASATDDNGDLQSVSFSRPTSIAVEFDITLTYEEGIYGGGLEAEGDALVQQVLKTLGDTLLIGDDVILVKFICEVLDNVPGVTDISSLKAGKGVAPTLEDNLIYEFREQATFDTADITVNSSPA